MGSIKAIADELLNLSEADQSMRNKVGNDQSAWDFSVDERSTKRLKEIVQNYGWPTISLVGKEASNAAWLLAQHSPDFEFMKRCLNLMEQLPKGDINPANIAYIKDRVLTMEGKPQIYGTQFLRKANKLEPFPIKDPENVDKRRADVGLESFADNESRLKELYR